MATAQCEACEITGSILCSIGCGFGAAIVCSIAGIGTIAGAAACGAIAAGFCTALTIANEELTGTACSSASGIEYACGIAGYC